MNLDFVKYLVEAFLTIALKAAIKVLSQKDCEDLVECILKETIKRSEKNDSVDG